MPYAPIESPTLAQFDAAIYDGSNVTPLDTEDADQIAAIERQTRKFISDYFAELFTTSTNKLLPAAVENATVAGKINGSTSNTGTQQGIVQGTVSTVDLRDDAVSTAKIAAKAVTTTELGDAAVTATQLATDAVETAKIKNDAVTTDKIAANAITSTELATGSVIESKIDDNAVTSAKIVDEAVTLAKLADATGTARILLSDSGSRYTGVVISGGATISDTGVVTITASGIVILEERFSSGVGGGTSAAADRTTRGTGVAYTVASDARSLLAAQPTTDGKIKLDVGFYRVRASAPAFDADLHRIELTVYDSGDNLQATFIGTSEKADGQQTRSFIEAYVEIESGDYMLLKHYTQTAIANGLGTPTSIGTHELYAQLIAQPI